MRCGQLVPGEEAGKPAAQLAQRGMLGGMGPEVVRHQVVEAHLTQVAGEPREVLGQAVAKPVEVHVGVDAQLLGGVELPARRDEEGEVVALEGALLPKPADPVLHTRGRRDELPDQLLGPCEIGHVVSVAPASTRACSSRARVASASSRSQSGIASSHSMSVGTAPRRATARR